MIDFIAIPVKACRTTSRSSAKKQEERGFVYGKHYGLRDLKVREWTSPSAKPRVDIAKELGLTFVVVPKIDDKADAIEVIRAHLGEGNIQGE
jgi:hypothetical protein